MINTVNTKKEQLESGYFKTGSGNEVILIMGSCRSVPYLNYLNDWNLLNGNRFTICFIDPFNWNWNINEDRIDYNEALAQCETNENIATMLRSTTIFIHEYYANAGMFNCNKSAEKNIYQFGLKPTKDITIPNFNDLFILTMDIVSFDLNIKKMAIQDYNVNGKLSPQTLSEIETVRNNNLKRFYDICSKTDFPEFAEIFRLRYKSERFFWNSNHVAKNYTLDIFQMINNKYLDLHITGDFWNQIAKQDLYANNYTYLCEYDLDYSWNEEIKQLKEIL